MIILSSPCPKVTKDEAAGILGIKAYDNALPQLWVDELVEEITRVTKNTDLYGLVLSSYVWCYDGTGNFIGYPHPLTVKAFAWLKAYDLQYDTHYADEVKRQFNVLDIE